MELVGIKIPRVGSWREARQGVWRRGRVSVLPGAREETGSGDGAVRGQEGDGRHHKASIRNHGEDQDVLWGRRLKGAASWGWYPREASGEQGQWGKASHAVPQTGMVVFLSAHHVFREGGRMDVKSWVA